MLEFFLAARCQMCPGCRSPTQPLLSKAVFISVWDDIISIINCIDHVYLSASLARMERMHIYTEHCCA